MPSALTKLLAIPQTLGWSPAPASHSPHLVRKVAKSVAAAKAKAQAKSAASSVTTTGVGSPGQQRPAGRACQPGQPEAAQGQRRELQLTRGGCRLAGCTAVFGTGKVCLTDGADGATACNDCCDHGGQPVWGKVGTLIAHSIKHT